MKTRSQTQKRNKKIIQEDLQPDTNLSPDKFSLVATRIATAQIIQTSGYKYATKSALNALSDITTKYLQTVAALGAKSAGSSGRTECNLYDIVKALEDVGSGTGFLGASNLDRPILASSKISELSRFVRCSREIPFSQAFRKSRESEVSSCKVVRKGKSRPGHVPEWLPEFPNVIEREREVVRRKEGLFGEFSESDGDLRNECEIRGTFQEKDGIVGNRCLAKGTFSKKNGISGKGLASNETGEKFSGKNGVLRNGCLASDETKGEFFQNDGIFRKGCLASGGPRGDFLNINDGVFKGGIGVDLVDEKVNNEFPKKREIVRFKIKAREVSGICKGGKRVSCENKNNGDDDDNRGKKRKTEMKSSGIFDASEKAVVDDLLKPLIYYKRRKRI